VESSLHVDDEVGVVAQLAPYVCDTVLVISATAMSTAAGAAVATAMAAAVPPSVRVLEYAGVAALFLTAAERAAATATAALAAANAAAVIQAARHPTLANAAVAASSVVGADNNGADDDNAIYAGLRQRMAGNVAKSRLVTGH
jgi:hypothetical protein